MLDDLENLVNEDLQLLLADTVAGEAGKDFIRTYDFDMHLCDNPQPVGHISLRIWTSDYFVRYVGHIAYAVVPEFRGRHYAARACKLLVPLARQHGLRSLWITCNPENLASRRTCELVGAELVEVVDVPEGTPLYERGERQKCRYRLDL